MKCKIQSISHTSHISSVQQPRVAGAPELDGLRGGPAHRSHSTHLVRMELLLPFGSGSLNHLIYKDPRTHSREIWILPFHFLKKAMKSKKRFSIRLSTVNRYESWAKPLKLSKYSTCSVKAQGSQRVFHQVSHTYSSLGVPWLSIKRLEPLDVLKYRHSERND